MERFFEEKIKESIISWEEKTTDVGFNRDVVWDSISTHNKRRFIPWRKIAVASIFAIFVFGWGYSTWKNLELDKRNERLICEAETMNREVKELKEGKNLLVQEIFIHDTIWIEVESEASKFRINKLEKKNEELELAYNKLNDLFNTGNQEISILQDSLMDLTLLINEMSNYQDVEDVNTYALNSQVGFEINEHSSDQIINDGLKVNSQRRNSKKGRFKLVLFNKME